MLENKQPKNLHESVMNRICEEVRQEISQESISSQIEWTPNLEILFFYSLLRNKPVGVNRHFRMLSIQKKFSTFLALEVPSKVIWDHLDSMYDMAALNESEVLPFPNDEVDFELPEDCHDLLLSKHGISLKKSDSETDLNKENSNNIKASKKIKQSSTPLNTPKSTFATPVATKPVKAQAVMQTETKSPVGDPTPKINRSSEMGASTKVNKVKRSTSPFTAKLSESATTVKEGSPDIPSNRKVKSGRSSSPAVVKKPGKADSSTTASSSKKLAKSESSGNGLKTSKTEPSDNSVKKSKLEKDQASKKGRINSPADIPSKKFKAEVNSMKKRSESESSRKSNDSSSTKTTKPETKSSSHSSKVQETETSTPSGSRKSSPVVKVKNDSNKKFKRARLEESAKKSTNVSKRRRP